MLTDTLKQAASGQWDTLLQNLAGLSEPETTPSKTGMPCPHCGGHDRYEFKSVEDGYYLCRGCGAGDGWSMLMKRLGVDFGECMNQVAQYLGLKRDTSYTPYPRRVNPSTPKPSTTYTRPRSVPDPNIVQKARRIWQQAPPASPDHPYLVKKKLPPIHMKQYRDCLVSALYNPDHQLVNLQFIDPQGQKRFLKGGQTKGCFQCWQPGWGVSWSVYLCEGVADALATFCHFHQGRMTVAAYSVSNMITVSQWLREALKDSRIIAILDNDAPTQSRPWRAGATALMAHNSFDEVIVPPVGMDASDLWVQHHVG